MLVKAEANMALSSYCNTNAHTKVISLKVFALVGLLMLTGSAFGASSDEVPDAAILDEFQAIHGISKQEAVDRIAQEAEARRLHHALRDHLGSAWAGSWIDPETARLIVATTDDEYAEVANRLGVEVRSVRYSQEVLSETTSAIREQRSRDSELEDAIRASFINYPSNSVVLQVAPGTQELVQNLLDLSSDELKQLRFEPTERIPDLSAFIRGANCYENDDSGQKCSVGFSVEDDSSVEGYMTAAHCAMDALDPVSECDSSTAIGDFEGSDWPDSDSAWVDTNTSYSPVSQINGYSDGILSVPSENAGTEEAPLYSTVCRYGRKTRGPHCGQIQEKDVNQEFCLRRNILGACVEDVTIPGVTRTDACIDSGDSGGPYITGDGQAQGTLVGGENGSCDPSYSGPEISFFQPVLDTASLYDLSVLTTHGANAPSMYGFTCPEIANSGNETYTCRIDHFDAQGITDLSWSTNTGDSSQSLFIFGTCFSSQTVSVTLTVSNQYGTDQSQTSFPCPTYPIP